jgi:glutaredoxin
MKKFAFIYLPILFLIYVSTETLFRLNDASTCDTQGCELAANLLKFDSIYLNYLGVLCALLILILGVLSIKKRIDEKLFFLVLYASILFETIMIAYQYWVIPLMCQFCLGVYAFLLLIGLFASLRKFIFLTPFILANIVALSFLDMPKSINFIDKNRYYLIESVSCENCEKVKEYLKSNNIEAAKIDIDNIEASNFLTFLNISTIPTLIINEKDIKIVNGYSEIIKYLSKGVQKQEEPQVDIGNIFNKNQSGCGFNVLNPQSCD